MGTFIDDYCVVVFFLYQRKKNGCALHVLDCRSLRDGQLSVPDAMLRTIFAPWNVRSRLLACLLACPRGELIVCVVLRFPCNDAVKGEVVVVGLQ